jgi:hypothetical protein
MSRHRGRRRCSVVLVVFIAVMLAACSTDTADEPAITPSTTSGEQTTLDPFDSSGIGRTWQQEVVTTIIDVGQSRADVDDADIVAALTASYAESEWSIRLTGRNLLGWSTPSIEDPVDSPNSNPEIVRALNGLYDRISAIDDHDSDISAKALKAQVSDTTKRVGYYTDRLCDGESKRTKLCTPDLAEATYREALTKAEAAYSQLGR